MNVPNPEKQHQVSFRDGLETVNTLREPVTVQAQETDPKMYYTTTDNDEVNFFLELLIKWENATELGFKTVNID